MIVVEDDPADVPSWLFGLTEMQLIVHVVPQTGPTSLDAIESAAGGSVVTSSGTRDVVLINGQNAPVITMVSGEWYRWRLVFVSVNHRATLKTTGSGCEFGVLAKDGIYVEDAPRALDYMKFSSGNRVDIVIRCTTDSTLVSDATAGPGGRRRMQHSHVAGGESVDIADAVLATIEVSGADTTSGSLGSLAFTPIRPEYLQDLRTVTVHGSKEIEVDGRDDCTINGQVWAGDGSDHLFTVYKSTYEEYTVEADDHPLHIHVNPLQVMSDDDPWNQPGDWMDVVLSNGVYRQHLADYTGSAIIHCHWFSHEDLGCMSQFTIATCPTDDPARGVLGTCSTHETLGFQTLTLILIVAMVLIVGTIIGCVAMRWRRGVLPHTEPGVEGGMHTDKDVSEDGSA
jgi:hypothetical protein